MTELMQEFHEVEENLREELLEAIAAGMATLSEASDAPNNVRAASTTFSASDVDFDSDAWLHQFIEIQEWLNIGDLSPDSREGFLNALVSELEVDSAGTLDTAAGTSELTVEILATLRSRIEIAGRLQMAFLEDLDQGTARGLATTSWNQAWEEYTSDDEPATPKPVKAKADVWPIYQLTDSPLNLTPSYQRGDVWGSGERSALIESILRGIPLPSIILLRFSSFEPHEVVDGKQRLTAILRFVGNHPAAVERVAEADARHPGKDLEKLFKTDYPAFRKAWKNLEGETLSSKLEDEYYFPFKLRSGKQSALTGETLSPLQGKYYTQIKQADIWVADQPLKVIRLFEKPVDYKIPVIEYTQAERRQIHEVFKLYNKQGVHLNAEEIRNAVYHDVELTRGILFAAGDADPRLAVTDVAPALAGVPNLDRLAADLTNYSFGNARYRRTKVLVWVVSVLIFDPEKPLASTSSHANGMLDVLQSDGESKLHRPEVLADLFNWLSRSVHLHASYDELWSEVFMDRGNGDKWQELQLVGSLTGIALATIARPDSIEDLLEEHADEIRATSKSSAWKRPEKTQTKTQWDFVARLARDILEILEIDGADPSQIVRDRFGSSGYERLQSMIEKPKPA